MKHILITGTGSYIGNAIADYLAACGEPESVAEYRIDKCSLRDGAWEERNLSGYDAVIHVAGKAHADVGHVTDEEKAEYYKVNTDLAEAFAKKAKRDGVKQFIYLSSVIVYGDSAGVGKKKIITAQTKPQPANFYGDSKLQAEKKLEVLGERGFQVAILRLPLVYGKGSKGNYPMLEKIADRLPVFPDVENERSMLYIENLAEFVRQLMEKGEGGLFFPQNGEYARTADIVQLIAAEKGKKVRLCKGLNPFVRLASKMSGKVGTLCNKAFGSLAVDQDLSAVPGYDYRKYTLEESIRRIYEDQHYNGGVQQ